MKFTNVVSQFWLYIVFAFSFLLVRYFYLVDVPLTSDQRKALGSLLNLVVAVECCPVMSSSRLGFLVLTKLSTASKLFKIEHKFLKVKLWR